MLPFSPLHRAFRAHRSAEARLIFNNGTNPEAQRPQEATVDIAAVREGITKRMADPARVIAAINQHVQAAEKDGKVQHAAFREAAQKGASAEFGYINSLPLRADQTAEQRRDEALAATRNAMNGIATVELNATNDGVVIRLNTEITTVNIGTEVTTARLQNVPDGERKNVRDQLNTAMQGMPEPIRKAVVTAVESLNAAQIQALPGLFQKITDTPAADRATAVRYAMSLNLAALPAAGQERTKAIRALPGINAAQTQVVDTFLGTLTPEQITLLGALAPGMAAVERQEAEQVDSAAVLKQANALLTGPPAFNYSTATPKARDLMMARLQMVGIDPSSDLSTTPPTLVVCTGEPWERAMNKFMGIFAVLSALGNNNRNNNERNTKVAAAPTAPLTPLRAAGENAQKNGDSYLRQSSGVEVQPGTPPTFIFRQDTGRWYEPNGPDNRETIFTFNLESQQWQMATGRAPNARINVSDENALFTFPAGITPSARAGREAMNSIINALRPLNAPVAKIDRADMQEQITKMNGTLNGVRLEFAPQGLRVRSQNGQPFRLPEGTVKQIRSQLGGTEQGVGANGCDYIDVPDANSVRLASLYRLLPRTSNIA